MIYSINGQKFDSDFLEHHGILGMKWGIRRYQNKDGTWTEEGLRRRQRQDQKEYTKAFRQRYKKNGRNPFFRASEIGPLYGEDTPYRRTREQLKKLRPFAEELDQGAREVSAARKAAERYFDEYVSAEEKARLFKSADPDLVNMYTEWDLRHPIVDKNGVAREIWMEGGQAPGKYYDLSKRQMELSDQYTKVRREAAKELVGGNFDKRISRSLWAPDRKVGEMVMRMLAENYEYDKQREKEREWSEKERKRKQTADEKAIRRYVKEFARGQA